MSFRSLAAVAWLSALLLAGCSTSAEDHPKPPLDLNLAPLTDWSSELVFVDAMKPARPWISQGKDKPWGHGRAGLVGDVQQRAGAVVVYPRRRRTGVYDKPRGRTRSKRSAPRSPSRAIPCRP